MDELLIPVSNNAQNIEKPYDFKFLLKIALTATLSSFLFGINKLGYEIGVFNTCQNQVSKSMDWGRSSRFWISLNTAMMPMGAALGSAAAGKLANSYGRRTTILWNDALIILGSIIVK